MSCLRPQLVQSWLVGHREMVQNLIWATAYNTIAISMVAGITLGTGFLMTPPIAAVFMSASTVIVAINAQFLR